MKKEHEMGDVDRLHDAWAREALLLTPEEAARLLSVGRTTVYALMKAGDLRPVHIGRSCRISHAELERFVDRLDAPLPSVPRRSPGRRRTATDQGALFDFGPTSPDVACVHSRSARVRTLRETEPPGHEDQGVVDGGTRVER